jgi:DNA polymerase III subunit delta'
VYTSVQEDASDENNHAENSSAKSIACGKCRSCILFATSNHPDYFPIQPEEEGSGIKVEKIRSLIHSLSQTSAMNGLQVATIFSAESLNSAASNALLKTLEEPSGNVLILLVSSKPNSIAATIRSRCQVLKITTPRYQEASKWLATQLNDTTEATALYLSITDNLPLRALDYATHRQQALRDHLISYLQQIQNRVLDPVSAAEACLTSPLIQLQFLQTLTMDMIRIKLSINKAFLNHCDKIFPLTELCRNIPLTNLFKFLDDLLEATRLLVSQHPVNLQLLMEKVMISWRYLTSMLKDD